MRGEERQRHRAGRDVLADRELALLVAEPLPVERHQVDGRQVRLGRDAALAQPPDHTVAVARDLHDEHEPAADVAAGVLARQRDLGARQRLAVPAGHPRAGGQHLVEPLELGKAERARDVGQPVVEPEPVVVEPVHVRRAPLVALGVDALLVLRRAHGEHAALAGGELLVGVERERRGMAAAADRRAVGMHGAERLAGVLDDRQPVALERGDVGGVAEDVHRQQRRRATGDRGGRRVGVEVEGDRVDVGEHGGGALVDDRVGGGHERERRRDHLVALADPDRAHGQVQCRRAARDGARVAGAHPGRERALELRNARAERELPGAQNLEHSLLLGLAEDGLGHRDRHACGARVRTMPASSESTSASQLASITFSCTPMAPQVSEPSVASSSTRVVAPVAFHSSRMRTL